MGINNWIRSKINRKEINVEEKEESLPEKFTIDIEQVKKYQDFLWKKEHYGDEYFVTKEYNSYMETDIAKLLSMQISDFKVKAIMVENLPYKGSLSDTLKFDIKEPYHKFRNPSIVLAGAIKRIDQLNIKTSIYQYIKLFAAQLLNFEQALYKTNKILKIKHSPSYFQLGEKDNNNKEICFVKSFTENVNQIEGKQLHLSPNIFRKKSNAFKGIIIHNLSLESNSNSELMDIDKSFERLWSEDSDEFAKMAFKLYKKTNGRILFVSQMDDIVVVKGTDESEPIIYSTLDEMNLPEELKKLPRYGIIRTGTVNSPENNKEFYNEHSK